MYKKVVLTRERVSTTRPDFDANPGYMTEKKVAQGWDVKCVPLTRRGAVNDKKMSTTRGRYVKMFTFKCQSKLSFLALFICHSFDIICFFHL